MSSCDVLFFDLFIDFAWFFLFFHSFCFEVLRFIGVWVVAAVEGFSESFNFGLIFFYLGGFLW